jgi:hypothetical protein
MNIKSHLSHLVESRVEEPSPDKVSFSDTGRAGNRAIREHYLAFQDRAFKHRTFSMGNRRVGVRPGEIQDGGKVPYKAGLYGAGYKRQVQYTQPELLPRAQWVPLAKDRRHLRTKTRSRDNKHLPSHLLELCFLRRRDCHRE